MNLNFVIPVTPRSKKNKSRIVRVKVKGNYITRLLPSKEYMDYEKDCGNFMPLLDEPISEPVNLKCLFYVPDKRKRDICNYLEGICDVLVKYNVVKDDNHFIIAGHDGTRMLIDPINPRTEIFISSMDDLS